MRIEPTETLRADRLLRYAPAGVAAVTGILVLIQVVFLSTLGVSPQPDYALGGQALAVAAFVLPPHLHHVYAAAKGSDPRGGAATLAALTVIMVAGLLLVGSPWLPMFYALAVSGLIVLRHPWSAIFAGVVVAIPTPLALWMGDTPFYSVWYTIAVVFRGSAVFALVWLFRSFRLLQAARVALAEEAVMAERRRIDAEIQRRLGTALEAIEARGRRALVTRDPGAFEDEIRDLVDGARRTLAEVRHLIGRYHGTSAQAVLDTAVSLLSAAGISTEVVMPEGALPPVLSPGALVALRSATARMLAAQHVRHCVVAVTVEDDMLGVEIRPDGDGTVRT